MQNALDLHWIMTLIRLVCHFVVLMTVRFSHGMRACDGCVSVVGVYNNSRPSFTQSPRDDIFHFEFSIVRAESTKKSVNVYSKSKLIISF